MSQHTVYMWYLYLSVVCDVPVQYVHAGKHHDIKNLSIMLCSSVGILNRSDRFYN